MSSTSLTLTQPLGPTGRSRLLCLPFELRYDIYKTCLYSSYDGEINEHTMCSRGNDSDSTALLLTCKQIYNEARPLIYRKMTVSYSLHRWDHFLNRIGPQNISLIQDLTIYYTCSPIEYWQECRGYTSKKGKMMITNKWLGILEAFHRAQPNLRLKKITMCMGDCGEYWPRGSNGLLFASHYHKYRKCRIYNELELLKGMSKFSGVHQIVFQNNCNPLWSMFLRRRLGFILKRAQNGTMTLVNPNHPHGVDLRNHVPSKLLEGVYDERHPRSWENRY
ncbi:hypothetical protein F4776DRAFT_673514 [Hypoxylon sp. NC0597]|nr:hypothetical protein F4776DRAFT_673514 [Hypoxylon sp. NC0597]